MCDLVGRAACDVDVDGTFGTVPAFQSTVEKSFSPANELMCQYQSVPMVVELFGIVGLGARQDIWAGIPACVRAMECCKMSHAQSDRWTAFLP